MAGRLNPAEQTAAESDYEKKFNSKFSQKTDSKNLQNQEAASDVSWKTTAGTNDKKTSKTEKKKGRFGFVGKRGGKLRQGSAFAFIIAMLGIGVWYTSAFAPNILLVNMKEMYTNDLADATIALNTYYWKMMGYKIGRSQCGEKQSIKCKLSTVSRAQKQAFEKQGFTVIGTKVDEDNQDDGTSGNEKPESRYQVTAILPPKYKETVEEIKSAGQSWLSERLTSGSNDELKKIAQPEIKKYTKDLLSYMPIATGDMLWLYSQISSTAKSQVYSVFNPKSSFFHDTRFKQRIKSKYGLTKTFSVGGNTEKAVNSSFDKAVKNSEGGINIFGRPDTSNGISLAALSNPKTALQIEAAMVPLAAQANSFVGLQCAWYSLGKAVTNDAKSAKAATVARFAMQYLQAADQIKAGTSKDITINTLSSKLGQASSIGNHEFNATNSSMYRSITYGDLPIPSIFGLLFYLDTFDLIAALTPAWSQIMATAAAQGVASNVSGSLLMPPGNLTGNDRDYCLGGETIDNHAAIKKDPDTACVPQIEASAPPGWQGALEGAIEVAHETCPPPHYDDKEKRIRGQYLMQPSLKVTATTLSPYIAGLFSINVIAWANIMQLFFTSQTTGVAAGDAIFAGTGEILGDMAQSRGMMPANAASMAEYLALAPAIEKDFNDVARYNARKDPFDPYNKFSFTGSIMRSLSPSYDSRAPLLATISNSFSLLKSSVKSLGQTANAFYYLQPQFTDIDPFNPIPTGIEHAKGLAQYLLRLNCPDPEYLALLITADTGCNVRYSMSRLELIAEPDQVLDYMTKNHNDAYKDKIKELTERVAKADTIDIEQPTIARQLAEVSLVAEKPFIDKKTGKAIANSEYDKFLQYCVNRQDPWGRSAIHVEHIELPEKERRKRLADKTNDLEAISRSDSGDPYQDIQLMGYASITEGTKADQDWYTGKKCLEQSEMLTNFRAYTMMCSVDGSLSGGRDCTDADNSRIAGYSNNFFTGNDILYIGQ